MRTFTKDYWNDLVGVVTDKEEGSYIPLLHGSNKGVISANISELRHSGYPEKQAIAIAFSKAGKSRKKKKKSKKKSSSKEDETTGYIDGVD